MIQKGKKYLTSTEIVICVCVSLTIYFCLNKHGSYSRFIITVLFSSFPHHKIYEEGVCFVVFALCFCYAIMYYENWIFYLVCEHKKKFQNYTV